jgi:hypothetical protein
MVVVRVMVWRIVGGLVWRWRMRMSG